MKRFTLVLAAVLVIAGCGRQKLTKEEVIDYGEIGFSDIVSYIVVGYQTNWEDMDPAEEMKLSSVYRYSSPYCGFAQKDINGDDIPELLIGDKFEDGTTVIYDIYTIYPRTASLVHLASGGERDRYTVNESGTIIEEGSNSASDSFTKVYRIKKGSVLIMFDSYIYMDELDRELAMLEEQRVLEKMDRDFPTLFRHESTQEYSERGFLFAF